MYTRNTTKAEHIDPPHHFIYPFLHRFQIPLPAKQAVQARGIHHVPSFFPSSPPLSPGHRSSPPKQSQIAAASAAVAFSKPQPPHHLPCPLWPSSLHLLVLQGCQGSKGTNETAPASILPQHSSRACVRSQPWNSGEGVNGGGWPIQQTVAKEVTVEVRGYLLGAFAPMTLKPRVAGHEARSERVASSAGKRGRKWCEVAVAVTGQRRVKEWSSGSVGHDLQNSLFVWLYV
jgi:hypothetical protein